MIRFIHAADIHLDSPLRGLANYEGCPSDRLRSAPREAFEAMIGLAVDQEVDFVIIAGDTSAPFPIAAINDSDSDGTQIATISASALLCVRQNICACSASIQ